MTKIPVLFFAILLFGGSSLLVFAQGITSGSYIFVLRGSGAAAAAKSSDSTGGGIERLSKKPKSPNKKVSPPPPKKAKSSSGEQQKVEKAAETEQPTLAGGTLNGLTTYFETPEYDAALSKTIKNDEIKVSVIVGGDGSVISAKAVSGKNALRPAAEKAALKANFYGSSFMGAPIKTTGELIYVLGANNDYKKYDNSPNKIPFLVDGGVLNGKEISSLISGAPSDVKGQVKVQVIIDEEGRVTSAKATSGNPALHTAATDSAKAWTFPRTVVLGNKVKVNGLIVLDF